MYERHYGWRRRIENRRWYVENSWHGRDDLPQRQFYQNEENIESMIRKLQDQVNQSKTKAMDLQLKVVENEQKIEDRIKINSGLLTELGISKTKLLEVKVVNNEKHKKFHKLQLLERENASKIREVESQSNALSYEIGLAQKEKEEAIAQVGKLDSTISGLQNRIAELDKLYSTARVISSVEREAKLKAEHLLIKTLGKHQRSSGVEKKLAENLHRNVVQELDGIRNGNYQLQFQNRGMKKALQRLRNRLKENIKEPD